MIKDKKQGAASGTSNSLFGRENYMWMLIGLGVLALGFFLMSGGKSPDPKVFNDSDVYSPIRITVAPILIIAGFVIEIFAIMKKSKTN
ncbi:MAG TPA: DUF3098 domain-containing protein [Ferruginibacter sp.]|nr:DUF3098 domain-containing protein [Ferruginibacter sp.]